MRQSEQAHWSFEVGGRHADQLGKILHRPNVGAVTLAASGIAEARLVRSAMSAQRNKTDKANALAWRT